MDRRWDDESPFVDMPTMPAMPTPTMPAPPSYSEYSPRPHLSLRAPSSPNPFAAPFLQIQPASPQSPASPATSYQELLPPAPVAGSDSPAIPLWTPDGAAAVNPGLPPPPPYVPREHASSRPRTRSNEDSASSFSVDSSASPSRRAKKNEKRNLGLGLGYIPFAEAGLARTAGMGPKSAGRHGGVAASEDIAARRRRNQKFKWGACVCGVLALFIVLLAVIIGLGVGLSSDT